MIDFSLSNKIAVATGGARGVDRAIIDAFVDAGARIVVSEVDETALDQTVAELLAGGAEVEGAAFDVPCTSTVAQRIAEILDRHGLIDILINNAGILDFHSLLDMDEACWDRMIGIHLKGTYNCTRPVFRHMYDHGVAGNIVNISSVAGKRGDFAGTVHYTAAKAGIIGFTRSLASLGGPRNIRVNSVAPGFTDTDMNTQMPADVRATTEGNIALRRMGRAEEIAAAVLFLASDAASYVTGETISVNGGSYMD